MTPAEIDDTDLNLLLDMEILDSKIDAATAEQSAERNRFGKKNRSPKHRPFSGGKAFINEIMNF